MKKPPNPSAAKKQIYFARTYRHLKFDWLACLLFLLLFVLPAFVLILFFYDEMTWGMCQVALWFLEKGGIAPAALQTSEFIPFLGPVYYLSMPSALPSFEFTLGNIAVSLAAVWLLSIGPHKGQPMVIYATIILMIHTMSCAFFLLGRDLFPYTIAEYSDLYVKQQVGIWISFLFLIGLIMGFLGRGDILRRIITVLVLMAYSILFGVVRYALFLWILCRFTLLYVPIMFFALGPFFDFLYFVMVYSISMNRMIRKYQSDRRDEWVWA